MTNRKYLVYIQKCLAAQKSLMQHKRLVFYLIFPKNAGAFNWGTV